MQSNNNWLGRAVLRAGVNLIVGGIITAIVGALCVGTAGGFLGYLLDLRGTPATWDGGFIVLGFIIGAAWGAWSGIVGAIIFGVAASKAKPGRFFAPLALIKRVALGQLLGTLGALSSYLVFALAVAQFNGDPFIGTVEDHLELAMFGAPITMVCGAIAGALWKRAGATMAMAAN